MTTSCSIQKCENSIKARKMCATHYSRWYRHGDPKIQHSPDSKRFTASYVDFTCPCGTRFKVSQAIIDKGKTVKHCSRACRDSFTIAK